MIGAIILAAGQSQRMGTQKLLLPIGNQPVIRRVVDAVKCSAVDELFVVVGRESEGIRTALLGCDVQYVINPESPSDMIASVRCGWRALPSTCRGALIVLGDQPGISSVVIKPLMAAFRSSARGIVVASYRGRRGHPLLIDARFGPEILAQHGDTGLRGLLQAHADEVLEIDAASAEVLEDLDTPADYDRAQKRLR